MDVQAQAVDEVLLGGDLAQGGRQPDEVLDLIGELGWPAVLGNADLAVIQTADGQPLEEEADDLLRLGLRWSAERLGAEHLAYLRALPRTIRRESLTLVHATPWSVHDVVLPEAPDEVARRMLAEGGAAVLAYGHIHHAYQRRLSTGLLASVGAVSGSNDRDPRPAYAVFTLAETVTVKVRRVAYDAAVEVAALRASGYPIRPGRAEQLLSGGDWPVRA